jgi:hypothetical protein
VGSGAINAKQDIIAQHLIMKDMKAARCASTAEELFRTATGAVVAAKLRIQDARIVLEIRRVLLQYRLLWAAK